MHSILNPSSVIYLSFIATNTISLFPATPNSAILAAKLSEVINSP